MNTSKTFSAAFLLSVLLPVTAFAQERKAPEPRGTYELELVIDGDHLSVRGGSPFNACAIMLGFEEALAVLPGNARLSVNPLVVLPIGEFDGNGECTLDLNAYPAWNIQSSIIFVQAIAMVHDSEFFATSNMWIIGTATMTGPKTQPVDSSSKTQPVDSDQKTQPLDSDQKTQPLDSDQKTQPVDSDQKTQPVDSDQKTQPLDSDQKTQPLDSDQKTQPLDSDQKTQPLDGDQRTWPVG